MERRGHLKLFTIVSFVVVLLAMLCGCQKGKQFDSPEAMIAEMTGTYAGSNENSGARIIIDGDSVIKFNLDTMFPKITGDSFLEENFPDENWEALTLDVFLNKAHVQVSTQPIITDIEKSTISGQWVDRDGILFSLEEYPLTKISSDTAYPTAEMQERFEDYRKQLQEYEVFSIVTEAENNLAQKKKVLDEAIADASSDDSSPGESDASAETIGECAFETLKDDLEYPLTAKLESYAKEPMRDPYGRVCTSITCTYQNSYGNYITERFYVVLQSCTSYGSYSHTPYISYDDKLSDYFLSLNGWNKDPNADSKKEAPYNSAIELMKHGNYELAAKKLKDLGSYKSAVSLKNACIDCSLATDYKEAIDHFTEERYSTARNKLSALLEDSRNTYLHAKRVVALCDIASSDNPDSTAPTDDSSSSANPTNPNSSNDSGNETTPPETTVPVQTTPMNEVPYTTSLSASAAIYSQPDSTSSFVQNVGQDGIYTIVEEAYDSTGNLWGKLKSGLGWVLLAQSSSTPVRTCPKCGKTEPDTVFPEDWKTGEPCFGCLYNSQGRGSDEKLICSQCGTDCTFLGLEDDGRCEDCHSNNSSSPSSSANSNSTPSQQPVSCSHDYAAATCITPQTCTKCGAATGITSDHTWAYTSCTTPKACSICKQELIGSTPGHQWKNATCTQPETCSACEETQGSALGHHVDLTKCSRCDYTDYSAIAKAYPNIIAYDSKTGEDLTITNVSVSSSGVLSFTFNGKSYSITILETVYDSMTYFDCYQNGSKLSNAECRIGDASYYNMLHFEWDGIDGHQLYFCTEKQ